MESYDNPTLVNAIRAIQAEALEDAAKALDAMQSKTGEELNLVRRDPSLWLSMRAQRISKGEDPDKKEYPFKVYEPPKPTNPSEVINYNSGVAQCMFKTKHEAHDWAYTSEGGGHMVDYGTGDKDWLCPGLEENWSEDAN